MDEAAKESYMADNIISGIHEQASMLPGHRVKWKKRGVSVTDTFTHEGMTVQVTYDTDYRPLNGPPGVRSWVTSIRLRHPDLDLQNGWSEHRLGYSTRFLSKRCSDLAEYATIYRLLEAAGLWAACKTYLPVVAGTWGRDYALALRNDSIEIIPTGGTQDEDATRKEDARLVPVIAEALREYGEETNRIIQVFTRDGTIEV
jgi:hypothetical protein